MAETRQDGAAPVASATPAASVGSVARARIAFVVLAAAFVVADQLSKAWVRGNLAAPRVFIDLVPGVVQLRYVENSGAAFGMFPGAGGLFVLIACLCIVGLGAYAVLGRDGSLARMAALGMVCGGAAGNLIDRIASGHVTDFIALEFIDFPVFNVADIGVVLGGVLLCIDVLFFSGKERKA